MNLKSIINTIPVYGFIRYRVKGYKEDIERGVSDYAMISKALAHSISVLIIGSALILYGFYALYTGEFNPLKLPQAIEEKKQFLQYEKIPDLIFQSLEDRIGH